MVFTQVMTTASMWSSMVIFGRATLIEDTRNGTMNAETVAMIRTLCLLPSGAELCAIAAISQALNFPAPTPSSFERPEDRGAG